MEAAILLEGIALECRQLRAADRWIDQVALPWRSWLSFSLHKSVHREEPPSASLTGDLRRSPIRCPS